MEQTDIKTGQDGAKRMWDEADIGSGERTAGQRETEEMIRQIPPLPEGAQEDDGDAEDDADDVDDSALDDSADDEELTSDHREQERSLEKDEPSDQLGDLDPVPPRG